MMKQIISLDPSTYKNHAIHHGERIWAETNCYVDLWIELLHAFKCAPEAALSFTLSVDFEGDQWTFFKFPLSDIYSLYGMDVQELAIWKPVVEHVDEQVNLKRPVLVELDSFYLPDTAGTAYQLEHVKTTVAVNEIDIEANHMGYFHNQGYFSLDGDDFKRIFHIDSDLDPAFLPPYVEFVKIADFSPLKNADRLAESIRQLRRQLKMLPSDNPFYRFKTRFKDDLVWLTDGDINTFHKYSFATLRQYGACYELASTYLLWLKEQGERGLDQAIEAFVDISNGAKALQFQLARAVNRKRELDLSPLDYTGEKWELAFDNLKHLYD
jgi:hypothetical protein